MVEIRVPLLTCDDALAFAAYCLVVQWVSMRLALVAAPVGLVTVIR
jgi:hypothetical protein